MRNCWVKIVFIEQRYNSLLYVLGNDWNIRNLNFGLGHDWANTVPVSYVTGVVE